MATLDWPTLPAFRPARFAIGASTPKSRFAGFYSAQSQVVSHMADRLRVEMMLPPCSLAAAGEREALLMQLASTGDLVRLPHFSRPAPAGRLRGVPVLFEDAVPGSRTIRVQNASTDINLLAEAQAFDAVAWQPVNSGTVTANVADRPNSTTMSADQITDDSVVVVEGVDQTIAVANDSATYTASLYVKATSGGTSKTPSIEVIFFGGTSTSDIFRFNTDTGALLGGSTGTVTSVEPGVWWRVSFQCANNGTGNTSCQFRIFPARCAHNSGTTDVTQTGSAIVWGAQFERGSSLTSLNQPSVDGGDVLGIAGQLVLVGYGGAFQTTATSLPIPLSVPVRQFAAAGSPVLWDRPTGTFELLSDVSQVEYLPGRYQAALPLTFQEVLL